MLNKKHIPNAKNIFYQRLDDMIDLKNEFCVLSKILNWDYLESELSKFYSNEGRPAKSIRLMTSLLILKQLRNVSDESVVAMWVENPYWQYFSGETYFQWNIPCVPTELVKFRNRIGPEGAEIILKATVAIHGKKARETEVVADTTVQEKNITFPTDLKLHLKIINWAWRMQNNFKLKLRRNYIRITKKLQWATRYLNNPKRKDEALKALAEIKTIAYKLLYEVVELLSPEKVIENKNEIEVMKSVLEQQKDDKNKIYSIHEPETACISKGKEHKKYEFGSKVSILRTKTRGIIVGALSFIGNPYDGNTLEDALAQSRRISGANIKKVLVDEGYRGRSQIDGTEIIRAHLPNQKKYSKRQYKKWFKRRAAVEASIAHLKIDYGMKRNYLKGVAGDQVNCILAASAFNIKMFLADILFFSRSVLSYFYRLTICFRLCF